MSIALATDGYVMNGAGGGSDGDDPEENPDPVEVDVTHSPIEYIDMVDHALSRLVQQFRSDPL